MRPPLGSVKCGNSTLTDVTPSFYLFLPLMSNMYRIPTAVIYSLIETAKETGLDPFRFLTWLLETVPTMDRTLEGWAVPLLPANAPVSCRTT